MRKLIQFFVEKPIWGNSIIVFFILFGVFSIIQTKRSFFPELDPKKININVFYPGASPNEIESGITIKLEQSLKGISEIEKMNSTSAENSAMLSISAYQDADMDQLLSDIENAVNSINSFPKGAEKPIITRINSSGMSSVVAFVGISSKNSQKSDFELIDQASKVEQDLLNTKEITEIQKIGFPTKQLVVQLNEKDMIRYGISIDEISNAIASKNIDITSGIIRGGVNDIIIRGNDREIKTSKIADIIVRSSSLGSIIRVGDVADVKLNYSEDSQESKYNGNPSVTFRIEKTAQQDISKITDELYEYQKKFNKANSDFTFHVYFEFNSMLNSRIELLTKNGLIGLLIVLVFLGLFLNVKLSSWVAFGIPFSFLGMFVGSLFYGMTINMISLFGMILVVGILVDDGIVIAENIYAHFEKGKKPKQAAIDGTLEVWASVFSSILTTIIAFSVLFFVEGLEMMREMAFVAIASLAFSLVEAFFILPAHLSSEKMLSGKLKKNYKWWSGLILIMIGIAVIIFGVDYIPNEKSFLLILFPVLLFIISAFCIYNGFVNSPIEDFIRSKADAAIKKVRNGWFKDNVQMFLKWHRISFFLPLLFLVIVITLLINGSINATFFPKIPPDQFSIEAAYSPGDNKRKVKEFIDISTQILLEENEKIKKENKESLVSSFSSNIGAASSMGQFGNHTGGLLVFVNAEKSKTPIDTLINRINRRLSKTSEAKLSKSIYVGGFNRFGKEIEFGFTSSNDQDLKKATNLIKSKMLDINGVINIRDNVPPGRKEVIIKIKPEAESYGLSKSEILRQIRQAFFGQEAQRIIIGTEEVKIWVKLNKEDRNSLNKLKEFKVKSPLGLKIPLIKLCNFNFENSPESLLRYNGQRIIKIDAESTDPDLVAQLNNAIYDSVVPSVLSKYPRVKVMKLGQFERSEKSQSSMQYAATICLVLMFMLISLHFNSVSQAFLIMLVIPAGIGGAILGHAIVGIPFSILSAFGIIALLGVLVNDAIVFLDKYNRLLIESKDVSYSALNAAISRFRPILLTSLTTVAGLLPLISETSLQAQFLIPMATSIAFGVLFGTFFILFFYPSAILIWNDFFRVIRWLWVLKMPSKTDVEPALKSNKD